MEIGFCFQRWPSYAQSSFQEREATDAWSLQLELDLHQPVAFFKTKKQKGKRKRKKRMQSAKTKRQKKCKTEGISNRLYLILLDLT